VPSDLPSLLSQVQPLTTDHRGWPCIKTQTNQTLDAIYKMLEGAPAAPAADGKGGQAGTLANLSAYLTLHRWALHPPPS
jgi:hypothetical protein